MFYTLEKMGEAFTDESKALTLRCAKEERMLLIQNIMSEKFAPGYEKLSPIYEEWKAEHGGESGFWKLYGSLVSAITIRDTPKGNSVGIEKNVMPTRSSSWGRSQKLTPIWKYAWYGEMSRQGFSKGGLTVNAQPGRPVFRPTAQEYRTVFLGKQRSAALDRIMGVWNGRAT